MGVICTTTRSMPIDRLLIEADCLHAAQIATARQAEVQKAARDAGLTESHYLLARNTTLARVEADHLNAARKATLQQNNIETKACAQGMWAEQYMKLHGI